MIEELQITTPVPVLTGTGVLHFEMANLGDFSAVNEGAKASEMGICQHSDLFLPCY
ncbi:MAG: hypothetical protein ABJZ55_07025 [Fuerstiella sp.]